MNSGLCSRFEFVDEISFHTSWDEQTFEFVELGANAEDAAKIRSRRHSRDDQLVISQYRWKRSANEEIDRNRLRNAIRMLIW